MRRAIEHSSPDRIAGALFDLKMRQFERGRILGLTNRYSTNTVNTLSRDIRANPSRIDESNLSQYIAVSTVLHNFDGWGFISRSLDALISGDKYSSVHLAYYAQLRAVMSIFAGEGLGVFSDLHVWFTKTGAVEHNPNNIRVGTHALANEGFKKWTRLKKKSNRILDVIGVEGVSLKEWIRVAMLGPGAIAMSQVTEDWLRSWGMDLRTLGNDHKLRNLASYRPQNVPPQSPLQIHSSIESLTAIWSLLKPSTFGGFEVMDRYLLRNAMERTYRLTRNAAPTGPNYAAFVNRTVDNLPRPIAVQSAAFLKRFLTRELLPDEPHLFQQARQQGLVGNSELVPIPVIARAVMLLRLATAVTSEMLEAKTVRSSDLDFWWELQGSNCGLWGHGGLAGAQIADLWEDIEIVLTDVRNWLNANPGTDTLDVRRSLSTELWELSKFQLPALWGMWRE